VTGTAATAFDGVKTGSNMWTAQSTNGANPADWLEYDFGVGNSFAIIQVVIWGRNDGNPTYSPNTFVVQYSDDNSAWTNATGNIIPATWVTNVQQTFTLANYPVSTTSVTWNPSDKATGINVGNANLTTNYLSGSNWESARCTNSYSSGLYYLELTLNGSSADIVIGVVNASFSLAGGSYPGQTGSTGLGYEPNNNVIYPSGTSPGQGHIGNIIGVKYDFGSKLIQFNINGGTFSTATSFSAITGPYFPAISCYGWGTNTTNFGSSAFAYSIPTGYSGFVASFLDTLTGTTAQGAYSLGRLLRAAYSGSAFQVRRSSDNTTQDIGFVGKNTDTASLLSFCSATNGFITKIYDQSGNVASTTPAQGSGNVGTSSASTGYVTWIKVTAPVSGVLDSLYAIYSSGATGNSKLALYSDSSGPNNLLITSSVVTNPTTGFVTYALTSPPSVVLGTSYWIGILGDVNLPIMGNSGILFAYISKAYSAGFPATGSGFSTSSAGTATSAVGMRIVGVPLNALVQATSANQPQVVSSGALLNPIYGFPSANGGYMTNPDIAFPLSSTMTFIAASVCTGGTASVRLSSFLALSQANDYQNTQSFSLHTYNTTSSMSVQRNGVTELSVVAGTTNATEIISTLFDATNVTNTITRLPGDVSGSATGSAGQFGPYGSLTLHHDGWNGGGTGELWTGQTSELIVAATMSSGDYTTAKNNLVATYIGIAQLPTPPIAIRLANNNNAYQDSTIDDDQTAKTLSQWRKSQVTTWSQAVLSVYKFIEYDVLGTSDTSISVNKTVQYAVLAQPNTAVSVQKTIQYAVLAQLDTSISVQKAIQYVVIEVPVLTKNYNSSIRYSNFFQNKAPKNNKRIRGFPLGRRLYNFIIT
jgi:hypothetical protein